MSTNQGLLQAQIKVKNTIDLNNAFSSPSVANPQLKSIEGDLNLSNEYALQSFNSSNTNTQHIDTIRTNSSNTSLKEALNNLPNLQYVRLEGSYESKGNSFDNNTNLQKVDLSESLQVKPEDFKANESLKTLPNLDYSNSNLTDIITNDTNLLPTTFDISNETNTTKLGIHGDSTHQLGNLEFVKVNPEAPFDNQITPQIDISYTSLDRNGLVNLFNTMPYNVGYQVVGSPTITDGVASGFSSSDYLQLTNSISVSDNTPFEVQIAFTPSSGSQGLCTIYRADVFRFGYYSSMKASFRFGNISSEGGYSQFGFDYTLSTGIKYIAIASYNGSSMTIKLFDASFVLLEEKVFENKNLNISSINVVVLGSANSYADGGSIDLNNTYIKINSQVSTGPVGYTIVGSPTIIDGVYTNDDPNDTTNRVITASNVSSIGTITTGYEYFLKFKCSSNSTGERFFVSSSNYLPNIKVYNNYLSIRYFPQFIYAGGETIDVAFLEKEKYYYLRVAVDNTGCKCYLGTTKDNMQLLAQSTTPCSLPQTLTYTGPIVFGRDSGLVFQGAIDFNETYIKMNGKLWFGHESKQVTWFNGKLSQIKIVDVSGTAGTSSLTNDDKAIVTNKGWRLVTDGSNSKNYTIEDGKLIWANPNIYLGGATKTLAQNTIPEIVDGVFTRTSNSPILEIATTQVEWAQFNTYDFEFGAKIDISNVSNVVNNLNFIGSRYTIKVACNENKDIYGAFDNTTSTGFAYYGGDSPINDAIYQNLISGPVFFRFAKNGTTISYSLSKDKQTWVTTKWYDIVGNASITAPLYIFQSQSLIADSWVGAVIDLKETYIKLNGQLWFYGKNYATQNIAPVPANYMYGTTTTSAIGFVDMRTQQFTTAPEGATYGWDLE